VTVDLFRRRLAAVALACAALFAAPPSLAEPPITHAQPTLRMERLEVVTHRGAFAFQVEIAATPRQQNVGLMFRPALAASRGMLFEFKSPQQVSFWMENCPHPLDMLFIQADGTILSIANAQPMSRDTIPSGGPITGVLEISGSRAAGIEAEPGDVVRHRFFHHG
jgi:uncharacterized membrane protein (UPF0127 family)